MWLNIVLGVLVLAYVIVTIGSIVVIILENRQPIKTMAWVMVLLAFPVIGLAIFYFFGQDFRKERVITRKSLSLLTRKYLNTHAPDAPRHIPEGYGRLIEYFKNENLAPPYAGNIERIYTSGKSFLEDLLKALTSATRHIHLESYIFEDDNMGNAVRDALIAAAKRGVEVRLIYDDVGCWNVRKTFFDEMEKAGIQVVAFLPVRFPRFTRKVNFRNHRKVCIVDGHTGFMGGMNIADRYLDEERWKDLHVKIQGSAVYGLQQTFLLDWYFMTRILINDFTYYPEIPTDAVPNVTTPIQIVTSSPASRWPDIMNGYVWAIHNARRYIFISTPYFMPTESILQALQMAATSGVDVRLMVTGKPESQWIRWANESYYSDVLEAGIRLYRYESGFHHSKYLVIDDALTAIGSANMDFRSFENNFEVQAFIYDKKAALKVKQDFLNDLQHCCLVKRDEWNKRSHKRRLKESFVRIFSPLF